MKNKLITLYRNNRQLLRYVVMAVVIVSIEYGSYLLMLPFISYIIAVPISMLVGIVLNWYFSRVFVFQSRRHNPQKEFMLVLLASLVGVGIQTLTAYGVVNALSQSPAIAKLAAIVITFFWNYYIRKKYIF